MTNPVLHPSSTELVCTKRYMYDFNLCVGNLKKCQTTNTGYSKDINSAAHAVCVNNEEISTVENLLRLKA